MNTTDIVMLVIVVITAAAVIPARRWAGWGKRPGARGWSR
jgi:hypothetical protein